MPDETVELPEIRLDAIGTGDGDGEGDLAAEIVSERGNQLGDQLLAEEEESDAEGDAEDDSDADGDEPGEESSEDVSDADAEEDSEGDDGSEGDSAGLATCRKLLKEGKVEDAFKAAFGDDFDFKSIKPMAKDWLAIRAQSKKLADKKANYEKELQSKYDQRHSALTQEVQQIAAKIRPAATWAQRLEQFKQTGSVQDLVVGLEEATGVTFQDFQKAYIQNQNLRPNPEVLRLKQELEQLKGQLKPQQQEDPAEQQQKAYQEQLQRFNASLDSTLSEHPAAKLPNWHGRILAEMRRHRDPGAGGSKITAKEAADEIVKQARAEAKALGLVQDAQKPKPAKSKTKPRRVAGDSSAGDPDETDGEDALEYTLKMRARGRRGAQ